MTEFGPMKVMSVRPRGERTSVVILGASVSAFAVASALWGTLLFAPAWGIGRDTAAEVPLAAEARMGRIDGLEVIVGLVTLLTGTIAVFSGFMARWSKRDIDDQVGDVLARLDDTVKTRVEWAMATSGLVLNTAQSVTDFARAELQNLESWRRAVSEKVEKLDLPDHIKQVMRYEMEQADEALRRDVLQRVSDVERRIAAVENREDSDRAETPTLPTLGMLGKGKSTTPSSTSGT